MPLHKVQSKMNNSSGIPPPLNSGIAIALILSAEKYWKSDASNISCLRQAISLHSGVSRPLMLAVLLLNCLPQSRFYFSTIKCRGTKGTLWEGGTRDRAGNERLRSFIFTIKSYQLYLNISITVADQFFKSF